MAAGDIKSLAGLVAAEALTELQTSVGQMSVSQRNEIMIQKDDIYLSFPYQVCARLRGWKQFMFILFRFRLELCLTKQTKGCRSDGLRLRWFSMCCAD